MRGAVYCCFRFICMMRCLTVSSSCRAQAYSVASMANPTGITITAGPGNTIMATPMASTVKPVRVAIMRLAWENDLTANSFKVYLLFLKGLGLDCPDKCHDSKPCNQYFHPCFLTVPILFMHYRFFASGYSDKSCIRLRPAELSPENRFHRRCCLQSHCRHWQSR